MIFRCSPRSARGRCCFLPNPLPERPGVAIHDDRLMWLADLGVNWLIVKDRRKAERQDRRHQRRREQRVQHEIDGPVGRREAKAEHVGGVSEAAQAEARRIMAEAMERAGVKD